MGRSFIEPPDFTVEELDEIIGFAERIMAGPGDYAERAKGKLLATLFYEPSTRTRFSFEAKRTPTPSGTSRSALFRISENP
jgi:aspartate carbamoyltransferase catalytic subunit